jgi:hypothetical protein
VTNTIKPGQSFLKTPSGLVIAVSLISGLFFIFFANVSYATCVEPDWSTIVSPCTDACNKLPEGRTACQNNCFSKYWEAEKEYKACKKAEEQQAEQKKLEEQKLLERQKAAQEKRLREEQQVREQEEKAVSLISGTVKLFKGKVDLIRDEKISEIASGLTVRPGDTIRTGSDSTIKLESLDGVVQIGEETTLKFIDLKAKPPPPPEEISKENLGTIEKKIELLVGKIRIWLKKFKGRYEVRTPVAVLGVRGTDFVVEHDPATNITTIYLNEGTLEVQNTKGETFALTAGETMIVDSSGKTEKSELKKDKWDSLLSAIETGKESVPSEGKQTVSPEKEKLKKMTYLSLILVILLIIGGIFSSILKRKKPKEAPETQLTEQQKLVIAEHQRWVKGLTKKIQIFALTLAAIVVVVGVFSSLGKIKVPKIGPTITTQPTIGKVPSAYSVNYNMISPGQQGTWKESVSGNSKKMEIETKQVLTSIYILGEKYYSCTKIFGQWSCMEISEPTYKPSSDPTAYSKEKPVFIGTKNIANRVANCYTISVGTICLDKETNILLESRTKTEAGEFLLTATSLNLNPPSQGEFILPAKPQKTPTFTP